jgi:ADP-ribose pyrophosphatase
MVELFTFLSTPGVTDEEVTIFVAAVDAAQVHEGALTTPDGEQLYVHRVSIDAALGALGDHTMRGSPMIIGLQWLALNRERIVKLLH